MQEGEDDNSATVWKLILSYDGTDFHGWQIQPGLPTIQGLLADAVASVTGEQVLPQGSGRTDAGVHAWGQVASFFLRAAIPADNLQRALNRILPAAIRILSAEHATQDFHARHSAVGKVYQYRIFRGGICSPFMARYVSICRWPLDLEAMQAAADAILGEHDFTSFAASDPDRAARLEDENAGEDDSHAAAAKCTATACGNIRRIHTSQWSRESLLPLPGSLGTMRIGSQADSSSDATASDRGEILTYTVCGNGFLHHMVRNLVGTFVEVGRGRLAAAEVSRILESRNRA
ncbi:MAG TPA: tRNA pseudouridine synthase A, partial [Acidobacteriaceae bacterium]